MSIVQLGPTHPLNSDTRDAWLIAAYRGQRPPVTPVWFMRQAGRSLPEYRSLRVGTRMLDACVDPELAAEITLQPVRRHGVDAAIFFSDIVVPLKLAGVEVQIEPGVGPVFAAPVDSPAAVEKLLADHPAEALDGSLAPITEAVQRTVAALRMLPGGRDPLIGFAGAPFTLASYLVEGRPSKSQEMARTMLLEEPGLFRNLLERLADIAVASLRSQVEAGVQAVQVFDSWAGSLSEATYREAVLPVSQRLFAEIEDLGVPRIHFAVNAGHLMEAMAEAGSDAMGVDWRTPLSEARHRLGEGVALQGNLDPTVPLAGPEVLERETRNLLADAPERGHVFNLGHGVLPSTDPGMLTELVGLVHEITEKRN